MAGVTVRLFADGGSTALESGTTAANGQVTFDDLDVGAYDIEIVLPEGFELSTGALRRDVTVEDDEVASVTFALQEIELPPTEGSISAHVVDGTTAVQGVDVNIYAAGGSTILESLTTNASGVALFDGLEPGDYDVEIELPANYEIAADDTVRKEVTVTAGETTEAEFSVDGPDIVTVSAEGTSFSPAAVTIAPGTTVRWVRVNGSHTVTPTDHSEWASAELDAGDTVFEHTFDETGTFPYHCIPHQDLGMTGTITVE